MKQKRKGTGGGDRRVAPALLSGAEGGRTGFCCLSWPCVCVCKGAPRGNA